MTIFCNIPSILIQSSASNSPQAVHSTLRLPCLWEQPKFATDTELNTTDLEQCSYPRTTWSSAALESSRSSESRMWLFIWTLNVFFLNYKAIHGVTEIYRMLKIESLIPHNWRNMKTHNLISGIKSEDTCGYIPDYTKPLTSIGCHIGLIFIWSDSVWLNTLLDNKNPRYRHRIRFPMLLGSKTAEYLVFGHYANSF